MSTITKHLLETATLVSESASENGTWKVKLISEGKGSSGVYPAELLENHHHAFDDVLSFKNHPGMWDGPETRDFTMLAGQVVGETWVENDDRGLKAVYGNYLPDPEYRDKLERYKDKLGLSIYIEGSGYVEEDSGEFIVDWFNPEDPYASVDVVIAPGARGKFMESMSKNYARMHSEAETSTTAVDARKEDNMAEIADVVSAVEALTAQVSALVADRNSKAEEAAQREVDTQAVEAAVSAYDAAVKAVQEADLLDPQRDAILESAKHGEDVGPLIENAKAIKAAALDAVRVSESAGRDFTGGNGAEPFNPLIEGWR